MSYNLYTFSIPVFIRGLRNLSHLLEKAQAHSKIPEKTFLDSRLAPDMNPFIFQVQNACYHSTSVIDRLTTTHVSPASDDESTFSDLQERIAKTIGILETVKEEEIVREESKEVLLEIGPYKFQYAGRKFVEEWVVPNFWFHISTAYALIRKSGAEIGKQDFIGDMPLV